MVLDFCFCFIMGIGSLGIFVLCSIIGHRASRDLLGFCRIIDIGSLVIFVFCFILGHRISWDLCVCDVCSIIGHRVPSSSSCCSHSQKPHGQQGLQRVDDVHGQEMRRPRRPKLPA